MRRKVKVTLKICTFGHGHLLPCVQEVTIRGGGLKHVACAEDEDFIQALDKMMLENLQVRHPATHLSAKT